MHLALAFVPRLVIVRPPDRSQEAKQSGGGQLRSSRLRALRSLVFIPRCSRCKRVWSIPWYLGLDVFLEFRVLYLGFIITIISSFQFKNPIYFYLNFPAYDMAFINCIDRFPGGQTITHTIDLFPFRLECEIDLSVHFIAGCQDDMINGLNHPLLIRGKAE